LFKQDDCFEYAPRVHNELWLPIFIQF
jgi:hypothetical protein